MGVGRSVASATFAMRWLGVFAAMAALAMLAPSGGALPGPDSASAAVLPSGFTETVAISGLTNPTVVRFAGDGRVFVAEKSGLIKVFDSLADPTPTTFADLRTNVHNFWDRGMLGMALPPDFPSSPYVYVAYTYDHQLGSPSAPPRWGDTCPTPPGATSDGCVVSARLSRLQAAGNVMTGSEQVLVEDWCMQYPSHTIGTVEFGPDGALYAGGGDGASFTFVDYGQDGSPVNPCGDPGGSSPTPPTAEGGALRTQDLRTTADPTTLDGAIIRVDPATGAGLPTNPLAGSSDANARRIIAYGQRNPFRFRFQPGTNEIWVGDVGWDTWEEINRIPSPTDSTVENFGWPCYEGGDRQSGYDAANLNICENLYGAAGAHTTPFYAYNHSDLVVPGESCSAGTSSLSGLAFAPVSTSYPASYQSALFFADYSRKCIWVMKTGGGSTPSPANLETFVADAANPVNLEFGPNGDLFYVDFDGGTIRRISTTAPPTGSTYLSDMTWSSMTNGWGPVEKDRSNGESGAGDGGTITLSGSTYAKGLGVHAASDVRYVISDCTRFKASVGMDDEVGGSGSVTFEVYADATEVYDSGVMTGATATKLVDVSIAGASQLRLVVTGGADIDYDHADWALARIECGGGGPPPGGPPPLGPPVSLASGSNTHSVAMADLDGDGDLDLVAANAGSSTASRWLGNGDGTFGARATFATGPTPKQVSVGDLNGDGDPDLVSANQDGASVSVLLGNGSGGFGSASNFGVCGGTHETALGHLNGDGALDIVVACWGGSVISVLIGNGNGTFAPAVNYGSGAAPHSVVLGHFDGDSFLDAAVANHGSNHVGVHRGVGNGTFQAVVTYPVGTAPHSIRAGDLDGDSRLDLVTANDGSANVSVLRGLGNGTFAAAAHYAAGSVPKGVAVADVTGGGRLDVLTANTAGSYPTCCQPGGDTISILVGNGDGTVGGPSTETVGQTPFSVAAGDLDGDGDLDIATANWHSGDVTVLENLTVDGPDTTPPTITARTPAPAATGVALGVSPTATFSEAMNPATLTSTTFTLTKQGAGAPVAAVVSYAGATATLNPNVDLDASSVYTALVKGGASGVKDVAGNPLTADVSWSFTTGTAAPPGETYLSDLTWSSMTNGWGPAEEDQSNGESDVGDGLPLTLNGTSYAKGLGVHAASDIRYPLSGCTRFRASVGIDDEVGALGSVTFEVYAGATEIYDSGVMTGATATKLVDVSIAGATQLRLVVTGGADIDYDHADWALARIECGGGGGDTTPPTIIDRTPAPASTGVALGVSPTATFSEAMNPATLTSTTFTLTKQGAGAPVAAVVSYAGATATLNPNVDLDASSVYTALVKGGASGVKDVAGNPLTADVSWSFTTGAGADTTPPTITARTPAPAATGVALSVSPTATFSEAMNPATLTSTTFTLTKQGAGSPVAAVVSYAGATATLNPNVDLDASSVYTALVKGGASGVKDVAGNPLAADVSWTFTTAATTPPPGETYLSDLTWSSMTNGWGPAEKDESNGESAAGDGAPLRIDGTTYPKGLGVHSVSDIRYAISSCTSFRATVGMDDEVGAFGSVVFEVYAGATKVYDSGVMFANTPAKVVDVSIVGASQLRLAVTNGGDDPTSDHADWALARIECGGGGGDTTPPTIIDRTPAPASTGVALGVSPTATFSEAMNPETLTTSTFTLTKQGAGSPVAAVVSYAGATATLNPNVDLDASSVYTALVKGGASGVKDVAGNPLAADVSWSFTTGAAGNGSPTPVIDSPSSSLSWKVGDSISFTGHATDPEQGALPASALTWTLLLQHCPAGCHTHTVQSWDDVASGSFNAPDHDFPSYLELRLTATDAGGASGSTTVRLDPQTVELRFESVPLGLEIAVNGAAAATPFTRTVIVGSSNSLSAPSPQTLSGASYQFASWSDGGAQTHNIVAPVLNATWSATYTAAAPGTETYLSDLTWSSMTNGWGPAEKDQSNGESAADDGAAITLGGTTHAKGLGVHSVSDIRYAISNCTSFKAIVGIDDETGGYGSVSFEVYADATKVFDSGVMFANATPQNVDVSIAGASQLRLVVSNGGDDSANDHADWALARIACG